MIGHYRGACPRRSHLPLLFLLGVLAKKPNWGWTVKRVVTRAGSIEFGLSQPRSVLTLPLASRLMGWLLYHPLEFPGPFCCPNYPNSPGRGTTMGKILADDHTLVSDMWVPREHSCPLSDVKPIVSHEGSEYLILYPF